MTRQRIQNPTPTTMSNNQTSSNTIGETMTLKGLIEIEGRKHPTRIVIPQLQRDYAQGRDDKKEVRDNFLNNIFSVLNDSNASERIYDFVYGKVPEDKYEFYPVDGQQRLTTFFLLHVYIGKRANEDLSFLYKTKKDGNKECNFSYETRDSSKLFCQKLIEIQPKDFADIVSYIEDQQWYNGTWENDPSIKSMMVMLGAIHERCAKTTDFKLLWRNLTEKIKFWVLPLEELKSSDALYIKMNSRGKHLSDFENFKAEVEGILSNESSHIHGSFAQEIDTTWTNVFWAYRNPDFDLKFDTEKEEKVYSDNGLDERMIAFLRNFLVLYGVREHIFNCSGDAEELSDVELAKKVFRGRPRIAKLLSKLLNFISDQSCKSTDGKLKSYFDKFLTNEGEQSRYAREGAQNSYLVNVNMAGVGCKSVDLFEIFMSKPTLQQKILGYAFFVWIIANIARHRISDSEFKDRLRILRNLIANSYLHDDSNIKHTPLRQTLKGVELLINNGISAICQNKDDEFSGAQKNQEYIKSDALYTNPQLQALIPQLENHTMLRGNLSQLMPSLSPNILSKFREIFNKDCDLDKIESALLTYGDYSRIDKVRRMYGGSKEENWRYYIMQNVNANTSATLLKALADHSFTTSDLDNLTIAYKAACDQNHSYDWRYYLSIYPEMRDIPQGVYRIDNNMRYSFFMCNASGNLQGNEQYWNPYNYKLSTLFPNSILGNWGSLLKIGDWSLNVLENSVEVYANDQLFCTLEIPQTNNVDNVDRIEFISQLIHIIENRSVDCICRFVRCNPTALQSSELNIEFAKEAAKVD